MNELLIWNMKVFSSRKQRFRKIQFTKRKISEKFDKLEYLTEYDFVENSVVFVQLPEYKCSC